MIGHIERSECSCDTGFCANCLEGTGDRNDFYRDRADDLSLDTYEDPWSNP